VTAAACGELNRERINLSGLSDVPGGPVSNCNWRIGFGTYARSRGDCRAGSAGRPIERFTASSGPNRANCRHVGDDAWSSDERGDHRSACLGLVATPHAVTPRPRPNLSRPRHGGLRAALCWAGGLPRSSRHARL
jgi:hypothetical protein